jgi:hypothetical protein
MSLELIIIFYLFPKNSFRGGYIKIYNWQFEHPSPQVAKPMVNNIIKN